MATPARSSDWYRTDVGRDVLKRTDGGRYLFVWEAEMDNGDVIRQFDEVAWQRALNDSNFVPPSELRVSTDVIPRDRVVKYTLHPTALFMFYRPMYATRPCWQVTLDPAKEELIAKWLVDHSPTTGFIVARQVLGKRNRETKKEELTVVSPSGLITQTDTEDISYEGE